MRLQNSLVFNAPLKKSRYLFQSRRAPSSAFWPFIAVNSTRLDVVLGTFSLPTSQVGKWNLHSYCKIHDFQEETAVGRCHWTAGACTWVHSSEKEPPSAPTLYRVNHMFETLEFPHITFAWKICITAPTVALPRNSRRCPGFAPPHCSIQVGAFPRLRRLLSWKLQGYQVSNKKFGKDKDTSILYKGKTSVHKPDYEEQMPLVRPYLSIKLLDLSITLEMKGGMTWMKDDEFKH